jgi:ketosteroid isomerase-like protein
MPKQLDEAEIRAVINAWTQGIAAKNTARVVAQLAPEVVQFDLAPPLRVNDPDPEGLESWFATWRDAIGYEFPDLSVTAGADVAFCHGLVRLTGSRTDGSESDMWFRSTLCLRKIDGVWKIAHLHQSVPLHMDGSLRAAVDLKP